MNDKLIQIGGKSYKECEVIMLNTEKATVGCIVRYLSQDGKPFLGIATQKDIEVLSKNGNKVGVPQNLYILSSEEIKEGDWVYKSNSNPKIFKWINTTNSWYNDCKKIITTTDTSLKIEGKLWKTHTILPQPSQQFITKYIESYNKGEIITDVLVEYESKFETIQERY